MVDYRYFKVLTSLVSNSSVVQDKESLYQGLRFWGVMGVYLYIYIYILSRGDSGHPGYHPMAPGHRKVNGCARPSHHLASNAGLFQADRDVKSGASFASEPWCRVASRAWHRGRLRGQATGDYANQG